MALVVETGVGLLEAESYASVAEFDAFCAAWRYDLSAYSTDQKEAALRQASMFVDTFGRYKGQQLVPGQGLEFPRTGLIDWSGYEVVGVPGRVRRACSDLAFKALSGPLLKDLDRGGRVVSESVGPISRTFAADAPGGREYQMAEKLLAPYLRGDSPDLNGPSWIEPTNEGSGEPFAIGMHDDGGGL